MAIVFLGNVFGVAVAVVVVVVVVVVVIELLIPTKALIVIPTSGVRRQGFQP
ncbi:MAG: hypothetical protein JZU52_08155 [Lamprocystis purpurea]|nr:hypothetical protein [Lamprocystis purpurea]